jgi:4-alpha-glucanotransferase
MFYLDYTCQPTVVAGVPPDYFSKTGQRWGNPLYRWKVIAQSGYVWWIERFRAVREIVDIMRIDHFRGFEKYWEIPADCPTAMDGRWVKGPGIALFSAVEKELGKLSVIAEDLGVITAEVKRLRERLGYPGMKVLQFAFRNDSGSNEYKPHNYEKNCVVYTGTHDNDSVIGWFNNFNNVTATQTKSDWLQERNNVLLYTGTDGNNINWDFIRLALASVADIAIVPLQDILGLGSKARMNTQVLLRGTGVGVYLRDDNRQHNLQIEKANNNNGNKPAFF